MSGNGGWEDLFAPLEDDDATGGASAPAADRPTPTDDPFGLPTLTRPQSAPPAQSSSPFFAPQPTSAFAAPVTDAPSSPAPAAQSTDPFAAMRERQAASQRAAAEPGWASAPAPAPVPAPTQGGDPVDSTETGAPLTRRELRERERSGETGAIDVAALASLTGPTADAPAGTPTPAASSVPPLVEPPAAAPSMTGPVFAAAWSAAAPPAAANVDAELPPPSVTAPAAGVSAAPVAATPTVTPPTPAPEAPASAAVAEDAPGWFAAAQAVAEPQTTTAPPVSAPSAAPSAAAPTIAAATVGVAAAAASPTPVLRTSSSTGLEDWRPRPVAGGGFPIPITVGGGSGGSGGSGNGPTGGGGGDDGTGPRRAPRPRRSKRWLAVLIPILVVLGLVGAAGVWAWSNYEDKIREVLGWEIPNDYESTGNGEEVIVTIRSGDIGADVARTLHASGVTMSFDAFYDLLLEQDPEPVFDAGNYTLQREMSAQSALNALQDPANKLTSRLVVPEGSVLPDVLAIMSSTTGIPLEEFTAAAATPQAFGLPPEAPSLEGYLFPATYELDGTETATGLIQRLVTEMFTRLDALQVPVEDRHRVLTLAGLIQRESGPVEGDPAKISRVFLNRIEQGMNLESDATVAYGTGNLHTVWTTDEERADASNPYNTYANPGLPIGPIGAPGEVAIQAALAPAEGPWLFFVPINLATGETMFSETFEEHQGWVDVLWEWCEASDENAAYCS